MEISALFDATRKRWPAELDISDAVLTGSTGFGSRTLIKEEERIDDSFDVKEGLLYCAIWPFHQALCSRARDNHRKGQTLVSTREVLLQDFASRLIRAFEEPCWAEEEKLFYQSNPELLSDR